LSGRTGLQLRMFSLMEFVLPQPAFTHGGDIKALATHWFGDHAERFEHDANDVSWQSNGQFDKLRSRHRVWSFGQMPRYNGPAWPANQDMSAQIACKK
jgi:hypothetical protein